MSGTTKAHLFILLGILVGMVAPATVALAVGSGTPMSHPTTSQVAITPDASVYGASLGFGKRWDFFRMSVSIPYYVLDTAAGTESGPGDVSVVAEWDIVPEVPEHFSLTGSFLWKLPTADEDEGLGTGETDYGAFLEAAYNFDGTRPFAMFGYLWRGDPANVDYGNTRLYSLGVSQRVGADTVYLSLDAQDKTLRTSDNTRLLSVGWLHRLGASHTLQLDASAGLNDASPDVLFNAGLMTWF